ncbi:MAG TPA: hypothetical protein VN634_14150 [Candidatus Limnocylindrales bacterium]|nr:hypothetical protein [Candidatus Limnocylindrales bacterium]
MSSFLKDRRGVLNFGPRRVERKSDAAGGRNDRDELLESDPDGLAPARLRQHLEQQQRELEQQRQQLEADRAVFEEDLKVLEDQRRFLDGLREKLRRDTAALEAQREEIARSRSLAAQRTRVESVLEDARKLREDERHRLRTEMAGLIRQRPR